MDDHIAKEYWEYFDGLAGNINTIKDTVGAVTGLPGRALTDFYSEEILADAMIALLALAASSKVDIGLAIKKKLQQILNSSHP